MLKSIGVSVTTTQDEHFIRTAIQMKGEGENVDSFDILDKNGKHIARVNMFEFEDYYDIDVICMLDEDEYSKREVLTFNDGVRNYTPVSKVAAIIYREEK